MTGADEGGDTWRPKEERDRVKGMIHRALRARPSFTCLFPQPGGCSAPVIDSHSVQKSPILRPLADAGNHVITLQADLRLCEPPFEEPPKPQAKRVGVNEATIFNGLCAAHDSSLFDPIENMPFDPTNAKHLFLATYRSVLMELHRKRVCQAQMSAVARGVLEDPGVHPLARDIATFTSLAYAGGSRWITDLKGRLDQALSSNDYSRDLVHWGTYLSTPTRFALTSCFTPSFDFSGQRVQRFHPNRAPDWISLSVFPRDGRTAVALTIPANSPRVIMEIGNDLKNATPDDFQLKLSELVLANVENIAISPDWWNALTPARREAITAFFATTVNGGKAVFPGATANLFQP